MSKSYQRALLALSVNIVIGLLAGTAQFMFSSSARAAAGDLFVTDSVTNSILAYATNGAVRTFATGLDNPQGLTSTRPTWAAATFTNSPPMGQGPPLSRAGRALLCRHGSCWCRNIVLETCA